MIANPVQIGPLTCGRGQPLLIIAGPCVIESLELCLQIGSHLAQVTRQLGLGYVFKASFDKANRTSGDSGRGPGLEEGLKILDQVRQKLGVPVTTDIHESCQAAAAAEVCDLLQIPAFLCRQTDLLLAAGATGKAVNVKKGQFIAPEGMAAALSKLAKAGARNILLCERGTFFGYGRLVNDFPGLIKMKALGAPVIFDATHSVQEPGSLGTQTGGNRAYVEPLARAAIAVGVDGLFFETHPRPETSPSDGPNMVPLDAISGVLNRLVALRKTVETFHA